MMLKFSLLKRVLLISPKCQLGDVQFNWESHVPHCNVKDLKYHPYKIQLTQELHPTDYQKRSDSANRFLQLAENENFVKNLIMTNEAHFHLNAFANKENCRFLASGNPKEIHECPLHLVKVTVWCGITSSRIIRPYFFSRC